MERAERETVVVVNEADLAEGFFRIGTSVASVARGIERRFPKWSCTKSEIGGRTTYWDYRVDSACLPRAPFISKRRRGVTTPPTEEARARGRARLDEYRLRKSSVNAKKGV